MQDDVCDNDSVLTCKDMFFCARRIAGKLRFQPGKPTQNAFVESFNANFRDYRLDLNRFASLKDARLTINHWRSHHNNVRPHRSIGKKAPAMFAQKVA